jgi:hypothetical protein
MSIRHSSFDIDHRPSPAGLSLPAAVVSAPAAAIAAAAAATAPAAGTAAKSAFGLRPGFVYDQCASFHLVLVELRDRFLRIVVVRHFHKCESACAASRHVPHHSDVVDLPRPPEEFGELVLGR